MSNRTSAGTGPTSGEAPLGLVSLAAFGLVLFWSAVCALRRRRWIAVVGLVLNGAPWAYAVWFITR